MGTDEPRKAPTPLANPSVNKEDEERSQDSENTVFSELLSEILRDFPSEIREILFNADPKGSSVIFQKLTELSVYRGLHTPPRVLEKCEQ